MGEDQHFDQQCCPWSLNWRCHTQWSSIWSQADFTRYRWQHQWAAAPCARARSLLSRVPWCYFQTNRLICLAEIGLLVSEKKALSLKRTQLTPKITILFMVFWLFVHRRVRVRVRVRGYLSYGCWWCWAGTIFFTISRSFCLDSGCFIGSKRTNISLLRCTDDVYLSLRYFFMFLVSCSKLGWLSCVSSFSINAR